jgi:serine/threonine-protein kinase RsbW
MMVDIPRPTCRSRQALLHGADEMGAFLTEMSVALACLGYSPREINGVRLALEEAIVNGLRHGNGGDASKYVRARYRADADEVVTDVEDQGPGFDPVAVDDPTLTKNLDKPSGRGLLLMRHYMTSVLFSGRGNRVTMRKRRAR